MKQEKTKIYVVTEGEYSDYHIITATLDKETAEAIAKKFRTTYNEPRVEEFEEGQAKNWLRHLWRVVFDSSGSVDEVMYLGNDSYYFDMAGKCYGRSTVQVYVFGDTKEDILKAAAERRAKHLAELEGL